MREGFRPASIPAKPGAFGVRRAGETRCLGGMAGLVSGDHAQYYPSPSADLDDDKDVDGGDFLIFAACFNGSLRSALPGCANALADLDADGDVDGADFLSFATCFNGSLNKPLPACFPPNLTACP